MKLDDIETIRALSEKRSNAVLRITQLAKEPLRLVLGSGGTATELVFSTGTLAGLREKATEATQSEIEELDEKLRALGVEI